MTMKKLNTEVELESSSDDEELFSYLEQVYEVKEKEIIYDSNNKNVTKDHVIGNNRANVKHVKDEKKKKRQDGGRTITTKRKTCKNKTVNNNPQTEESEQEILEKTETHYKCADIGTNTVNELIQDEESDVILIDSSDKTNAAPTNTRKMLLTDTIGYPAGLHTEMLQNKFKILSKCEPKSEKEMNEDGGLKKSREKSLYKNEAASATQTINETATVTNHISRGEPSSENRLEEADDNYKLITEGRIKMTSDKDTKNMSNDNKFEQNSDRDYHHVDSESKTVSTSDKQISENSDERDKYFLINEKDWLSLCSRLSNASNNNEETTCDSRARKSSPIKSSGSVSSKCTSMFNAFKQYSPVSKALLNQNTKAQPSNYCRSSSESKTDYVSMDLGTQYKKFESLGQYEAVNENVSDRCKKSSREMEKSRSPQKVEIVYVRLEGNQVKYESGQTESVKEDKTFSEDANELTSSDVAQNTIDQTFSSALTKRKVNSSPTQVIEQEPFVPSCTNANTPDTSDHISVKPGAFRFVRINNKLTRVYENVVEEGVDWYAGSNNASPAKSEVLNQTQTLPHKKHDGEVSFDLNSDQFVAYPINVFDSENDLDNDSLSLLTPTKLQMYTRSKLDVKEVNEERSCETNYPETSIVLRVSGSGELVQCKDDRSPSKKPFQPESPMTDTERRSRNRNTHIRKLWKNNQPQKLRKHAGKRQVKSEETKNIEHSMDTSDYSHSSDEDELSIYFSGSCKRNLNQQKFKPVSILKQKRSHNTMSCQRSFSDFKSDRYLESTICDKSKSISCNKSLKQTNDDTDCLTGKKVVKAPDTDNSKSLGDTIPAKRKRIEKSNYVNTRILDTLCTVANNSTIKTKSCTGKSQSINYNNSNKRKETVQEKIHFRPQVEKNVPSGINVDSKKTFEEASKLFVNEKSSEISDSTSGFDTKRVRKVHMTSFNKVPFKQVEFEDFEETDGKLKSISDNKHMLEKEKVNCCVTKSENNKRPYIQIDPVNIMEKERICNNPYKKTEKVPKQKQRNRKTNKSISNKTKPKKTKGQDNSVEDNTVKSVETDSHTKQSKKTKPTSRKRSKPSNKVCKQKSEKVKGDAKNNDKRKTELVQVPECNSEKEIVKSNIEHSAISSDTLDGKKTEQHGTSLDPGHGLKKINFLEKLFQIKLKEAAQNKSGICKSKTKLKNIKLSEEKNESGICASSKISVEQTNSATSNESEKHVQTESKKKGRKRKNVCLLEENSISLTVDKTSTHKNNRKSKSPRKRKVEKSNFSDDAKTDIVAVTIDTLRTIEESNLKTHTDKEKEKLKSARFSTSSNKSNDLVYSANLEQESEDSITCKFQVVNETTENIIKPSKSTKRKKYVNEHGKIKLRDKTKMNLKKLEKSKVPKLRNKSTTDNKKAKTLKFENGAKSADMRSSNSDQFQFLSVSNKGDTTKQRTSSSQIEGTDQALEICRKMKDHNIKHTENTGITKIRKTSKNQPSIGKVKINKFENMSWKDKLEDEAFKFDYEHIKTEKHKPVNVRRMIRKILKSNKGADQMKESKHNRKDKDLRLRNEQLRTERIRKERDKGLPERILSESDDAWLSDSGRSSSFPAFRFSLSEDSESDLADTETDNRDNELCNKTFKINKNSNARMASDNIEQTSISKYTKIKTKGGKGVIELFDTPHTTASLQTEQEGSKEVESPIKLMTGESTHVGYSKESPEGKKNVDKLRQLLVKINEKKVVKRLNLTDQKDCYDSK